MSIKSKKRRRYSFDIELELTSLNDVYGDRWGVNRYRKYVISQIEKQDPFGDIEILHPVHLEFQALLTKSQRPFDVMNYASTIKAVEDYMVKNGILAKDSPLFVMSHKTLSPKKSKCCVDMCKFRVTIIEVYAVDSDGNEIIPEKAKEVIKRRKKRVKNRKERIEKQRNPEPLIDIGDMEFNFEDLE